MFKVHPWCCLFIVCVHDVCLCAHVEIRTALWAFLSFQLYLVLHWTQVLELTSLDSRKTEPSSNSLHYFFQTFVLGVRVPHFIYLSGIGHLGLLWIMLGTPVYMVFFVCVKIMTPSWFVFWYTFKSGVVWWLGDLYLTVWRTAKLFDPFQQRMGVCFSLSACQCLLSDFGF